MIKTKNKYLLGILILTFAVFLFSSVSALTASNVTINVPAASGTLSGATAVFNVSYDWTLDENWSTANVYLYSAGKTANTTQWLAATVKNSTNALQFNGTLASNKVEDGNDYTIVFELWNGTNKVNQSRSGITINNTIPQAPTLDPVDATAITTAQTKTFTGTVTNANTTSCNYSISRGGQTDPSSSDYTSGSATYSGTTCVFTKEFTSGNTGTWTWAITASDENDKATSSATFINNIAQGGSSGGGTPAVIPNDNAVSPTAEKASFFEGIKNFFNKIGDYFKNLFR